MCVLAVESSTVTPSWQGKMDGPCYRFLADKSPYNHLISYYQQPQTLKLIFIGVKKKKSPMASSTFMVLTFHWWIFFSCECYVCVWEYVCVCPMQVETPGGTPTSLMESHFLSSSKHVQGDSPQVWRKWVLLLIENWTWTSIGLIRLLRTH